MKTINKDLSSNKQLVIINFLFGRLIHDFNNLLSVICGYSKLVKEDMNEVEIENKNINRVVDASERAVVIVRQIILFKEKLDHIDIKDLSNEKLIEMWTQFKQEKIKNLYHHSSEK